MRGWEIDRAHMDGAIGDFRVKKEWQDQRESCLRYRWRDYNALLAVEFMSAATGAFTWMAVAIHITREQIYREVC